MVFSSLLFLFRFLPIMLLAYYVSPKRLRNGILFLGSLIFYSWGEPVYVSLLLFSTIIDFIHGKLVEKLKNQGKDKWARCIVASSVIINLSLLGIFKYGPFHLPLPIGISFYTFQTMSYTIDVYRGQAKAQKDMIAFGAYVSMFPQLIAGPIVRYHTIAEELKNRKENLDDFLHGISCFIIGLAKKVLLANRVGALWTEIQGVPDSERTVVMMWLGILAFGMQIYFDFSGYSDMAIGLGAMFGFHFPDNFNYPYLSKSITEFWRRWHISLGTWFKEYVYIPLGGNQKGAAIQIRNILVVWILTGIWHGAGWNFLLWGLYFGVLLLLEKLFLRKWLEKIPPAAQLIYCAILVFGGWVLFAHDDLGQGLQYYRQLIGFEVSGFMNRRTGYQIFTNIPLILMCMAGATPYPAVLWKRWRQCKMDHAVSWLPDITAVVVLASLLTLCVAYLVNASYNPFLYFRF